MKTPVRLGLTLLLAGTLASAAGQAPRTTPENKVTPKFEVVAETKLLMEALAMANYRGLATLLKQKPNDTATWTFARGQALLIAETGNLLLLRPPRQGRDTWNRRSMELRSAAAELANATGSSDYAGSQAALAKVTNICNRCHQSFRINVRVSPVERPPTPDTK